MKNSPSTCGRFRNRRSTSGMVTGRFRTDLISFFVYNEFKKKMLFPFPNKTLSFTSKPSQPRPDHPKATTSPHPGPPPKPEPSLRPCEPATRPSTRRRRGQSWCCCLSCCCCSCLPPRRGPRRPRRRPLQRRGERRPSASWSAGADGAEVDAAAEKKKRKKRNCRRRRHHRPEGTRRRHNCFRPPLWQRPTASARRLHLP